MGYVAFLCGKCGEPLCADEGARGTGGVCARCGSPVVIPEGAVPLAAAGAAVDDGSAPASAAPEFGLFDLAALPLVATAGANLPEKQGFQDNKHKEPSVVYSDRHMVFYRLLLCMVTCFALLSAALNVYLVLRLRAADGALRRRACAEALSPIEEQKRGRINHLAIR